MAVSPELRRRIKSVNSTKQITKAMELVSSAKMRKANQATLANRPYSKALLQVIQSILHTGETISHPLFVEGASTETLLIVVAADRGQAGAYTTNVLKKTLARIEEEKAKGNTVQCVTLGKKIYAALLRREVPIIQNYPLPESLTEPSDLEALYHYALKEFNIGRFGRVGLIYTTFVSMMVQEALSENLLPLTLEESELPPLQDILYEPSPEVVLETLLPYVAEIHLYQALLEATASEHSARRLAMKNATDNATSMTDRLKLTYNRLRQGAITQEIAEITSGAAALE